MNEARPFENDPSQLLTLASSIARRTVQETRWSESIMGEVMPLPASQPVEVARGIQTGATFLMLRTLEHPDEPLDAHTVVTTIITDDVISNMLRGSNQEASEENMNMVRGVVEGQIKVLHENLVSNDKAKQAQQAMLENARIVSEAHSVALADVFENDELYEEYMRTRYTPETFVAETFSMMGKLDENLVRSSVEAMVDNYLKAIIEAGELDIDEYDEAKAEIMQDTLDDENQIAELKANLELVHYAMRRVAQRAIERFWGEAAVAPVMAYLGHAALHAPELSDGFKRQQELNDIIATICMQEGWDPRNLTVEQMSSVNARPEMVAYRQNDQD